MLLFPDLYPESPSSSKTKSPPVSNYGFTTASRGVAILIAQTGLVDELKKMCLLKNKQGYQANSEKSGPRTQT